MTAFITYEGYHPMDAEPYHYKVMAANGVTDELSSRSYIRHTEMQTPDEMWGESSGWAHVQCDHCGMEYWDRTYPGGDVLCPVCGERTSIPDWAELMPYRGASRREE